jgi:hypothetical protein
MVWVRIPPAAWSDEVAPSRRTVEQVIRRRRNCGDNVLRSSHLFSCSHPEGWPNWHGTRLENGQTERFWGFESLTLLWSEHESRREEEKTSEGWRSGLTHRGANAGSIRASKVRILHPPFAYGEQSSGADEQLSRLERTRRSSAFTCSPVPLLGPDSGRFFDNLVVLLCSESGFRIVEAGGLHQFACLRVAVHPLAIGSPTPLWT